MNIQEASSTDISQLAAHHRRMFEEIWAKQGFNLAENRAREIEISYAEKLQREIPSGGCKAWVVRNGERLVASGAISIVSYVPGPNDPKPWVAYLHSMYTEREFRGRAYASQIVERAIQYCRGNGISRIMLNASAAGKPIYEKLGFVSAPEMMRLFIGAEESCT